MGSLKRTPLFPMYEPAGGKLVDFGGWELPVQFAGIKEEHLAVRGRAGIFDVSHMGEVRVSGPGALAFLQSATTNDVSRLELGAAQYSGLLNPEGGFLDDIFVYRLGPDEYFLCVNAGNAERDFEWLSGLTHPDCAVKNESAQWAQIAIQGPRAVAIAARSFGEPKLAEIKKLHLAAHSGGTILLARTGYTGEDGFEIFVPAAGACELWENLLKAGRDEGLIPCGLGARDTLRLEMGYPLHGHDLTPAITPLEADLAWIVALNKKDFMGRAALEKQKKTGIIKKRVGLVMVEPGVPRDGYKIIAAHGEGKITSGTKTPSLDQAVAMGYVPITDAAEGTEVAVDIRGKARKARIQKWPFYRRA